MFIQQKILLNMVLLWFILNIININAEKIVTYNFKTRQFRPALFTNFTNDNNTGLLLLNTFNPYTILDKDSYKVLNTSFILNETTISLKTTFDAFEYHNNIEINETKVNNYIFYIAKVSLWYPDQGIGLGYRYDNESYSLVHLLYNAKKIVLKQFAFTFTNNSESGSVFFGGVPKNVHIGLPYQGYCKVNDNYNKWGCNITNLKYNNKDIEYTGNPIFHSLFYGVFYSEKLFDILIDNIFTRAINQTECTLDFTAEGSKTLYCKEIKEFNDTFEIDFGNLTMKFPISHLFEKRNESYRSIFFSNPYDFYNKYDLIVGVHFLNSFNYTVFNYDKGQVEFYSDTVSITMLDEYKKVLIKVQKILLTSNLGLLLVSLCMLIYNVSNIISKSSISN